jgi:hypothetical protein
MQVNTSDKPSPGAQRVTTQTAIQAAQAALDAREAAETALVVPRKIACQTLDIGPSYELVLEKRGELVSIVDGKHRRVLVSSIYARLRKFREPSRGRPAGEDSSAGGSVPAQAGGGAPPHRG